MNEEYMDLSDVSTRIIYALRNAGLTSRQAFLAYFDQPRQLTVKNLGIVSYVELAAKCKVSLGEVPHALKRFESAPRFKTHVDWFRANIRPTIPSVPAMSADAALVNEAMLAGGIDA